MADNKRAFSNLNKMVEKLKNIDYGIAFSTVLAQQKERIFTNGRDRNLGAIGSHSTNPISISRRAQRRNTGKTFFPGGYSEYKSAIGFGSNVNLFNTGKLFADYTLEKIANNRWAIGFISEDGRVKAEGNESRFGKRVFFESAEDRNLRMEEINNLVNKAING